MSKQVLSIEQMKHLQELGLDTSNASASWVKVTKIGGKEVETCWSLAFCIVPNKLDNMETETVPTFTLQDILDLLPKEMRDKDDDKFLLKVEYAILRKEWYIGYYYYDVVLNDNCLFSRENPIDAAYEMLCWCIENGYIETKK